MRACARGKVEKDSRRRKGAGGKTNKNEMVRADGRWLGGEDEGGDDGWASAAPSFTGCAPI